MINIQSSLHRYLTIFGILLINTAAAQELPPIQTDRPDQTECPFTVPKKYFQAEAGFSYEKINKKLSSVLLPTFLFKYGISERTELRLITEIEMQKYLTEKNTGLNPVTIGFKTNLVQERGIIPMISFIGHLTLPHVASSKNTSIYYAPAFRFTMQHTLSSKISLGYNLGAEWDGFTPEPAFIYTLTTGFSLTEKIGSFIELYGFAPQQSEADHRADAGITFLLNNNMLFDIAGGIGLNSHAASYFIGAGFSFRVK
ncbi:MAG: transporter [Ferruginibacter sp.]